MTQMREFREYAVNGREKYWKYERKDGLGADSVLKWTLTIHEPTCRYAKHYADGRTKQDHYRGDEGLRWLAGHGFAIEGPYARLAWQGCKVCGTFHREPEFKALAEAELVKQAEARAAQRAREDAKDAVRGAIYQRTKFIENAQATMYAARFKAEVDAAMAEVAAAATAEWAAEYPEQAALIPDAEIPDPRGEI